MSYVCSALDPYLIILQAEVLHDVAGNPQSLHSAVFMINHDDNEEHSKSIATKIVRNNPFGWTYEMWIEWRMNKKQNGVFDCDNPCSNLTNHVLNRDNAYNCGIPSHRSFLNVFLSLRKDEEFAFFFSRL